MNPSPASIYKTADSYNVLAAFMDTVLSNWPYDYQSQFIDTSFAKTHLITAGDKNKKALLMLHGAASNLLSFGGEIPKYRGDYYVLVPDIPGEAGKSDPIRLSWNNDDYLNWLDELLAKMEIDKISLYGISLGGWIAAKYAAKRPERVDKLVLQAPGGIVPAKKSFLIKAVIYTAQKEKGVPKMKRMVFGQKEILPELSYFFDLLQAHYVPRIGSPPILSDKELKSIMAHVLMIGGSDDAFFNTRKAVRRLKSILTQAKTYIIEDDHHGMIDTDRSVNLFLNNNQDR